ncbi:MAG: glycosyltransferase family 4 protein [Ignavibacteriales bacterium]|nr:glycosyltransferase family 4 protein [Ignavibacteriales bacterium]
MYCADTSRFSRIYQKRAATLKKFPRNFLFIGRLLELKGLIELCEVFCDITSGKNLDWTLHIVGSGPIKDKLKLSKNTYIRDFMQQSELSEVLENAGVFVFPSHIDAWGVVIHEAAAAGLPIISSDASGATPAFVRNAYNGYVHKTRDKLSIEKTLLEIIGKTDDELFLMGARSNELSKQINHEIWANTLLSIELYQ